jgi:hypothetical protein
MPSLHEPAAADLPPPHAAPIPSIKESCTEPSTEDSLPTPEIRLHIVISVVSHLNSSEEARSLSVEEQSLHEFLLDQILFLQKSLESWLVPRIIKDLLGREMVVAPLLEKEIPSPSAVGGGGQGGGGHLHPWSSIGGNLGDGGSLAN